MTHKPRPRPDTPHYMTEDRVELQQLARQFAREVVLPIANEVDPEEGDFPQDMVQQMADMGFFGILIPEEYGGLGLGLGDGSAILEQINYNGANSGAIHAQLYTMNAVLHHGSDEQKQQYLPKIATGELRLQAFGVTEPGAGTDTTSLTTTAVRDGDEYVVNGQKVFISRVQQSDLMLLLARTTPLDQVQKKSDGLSLFLVDIRDLPGLTVNPIKTMINHSTTELFFDDMRIPASSLIGEEGKGFKYVLTGMNAERILIASECIGDGHWFIERAVEYSKDRVVFNRPIGANQGIQFPIARAHVQLEAADLMRWKAADLFDAGKPCGAEANMAKMLASEASWQAGDTCLQTHGGFGMTQEYNVERKFRETRLYQIAPISTNLILSFVGQHVLGMPRSF